MEPPKHAQERQLPPHFSRELGRAITFLSRGRKRFMAERLRELGFSGAMYLILLHLEHHPGATQDSIANHLFIDKCNVARRTKKLETLGYLYRETNHPGIRGPVGALHHRGLDGHRVRGAVSPSDQDDRPGPKMT